MRVVEVDCRDVKSEAEFWERYVWIVRPEGAAIFGRNLDAFWDAVSDEGPGWPGECEVRFINSGELARLRDGKFVEALEEIARESTRVKISLS